MTLTSCIFFWSFIHAVDPNITKAVIATESNGNPFAKGKLDDYGLMQIRKRYVPESKLQLFNSCTNVMRGTALLKAAQDNCKLCLDKTWINGYNLGESGAKRLKYPLKWKYFVKIAKAMRSVP